MLKWAVGQRNPTPGQAISSCVLSANVEGGNASSCCQTTAERLYVAKRRSSRGAVRRAQIRSLKRIKQDKENQPTCLTPENVSSRTRDNSRLNLMALRDVSNSPDPYMITPRRHNYIKRRQSHPLNLISKKRSSDFSKSAPTNTQEYWKTYNSPECKTLPQFNLPQAPTTSHRTPSRTRHLNDSYTDITNVVDMRKPNSTLKSLLTMQIEYSPGPLTATQSLVTLRQRLTKSLTAAANGSTPQGIDNPLYSALNASERCVNNGITISCNEQSPTLEGFMEEKSIFEQVSNKFINSLKKENSRIDNTLVSSLSERLEWLRLNNSFNSVNLLNGEKHQPFGKTTNCSGRNGNESNEEDEADEVEGETECLVGRRDREVLKRQKCIRRKVRKCCDGACKTGNGFCCDKNKPKTQQRPKLMGLTLPLGIPSPITSEDSGLCSLGLEGIQPLSSSPIKKEVGVPTEEALSKYNRGNESVSSSLLVEKCSPSSICSSLRKRNSEDGYEARDAWSDEVVPLVKTPKLANDPRCKEEDAASSFNCDFALPSPLALVEKRSRSRRCLRFVSPGSSTCQRHLSGQKHPLSLSCLRLRDGREGTGDLELSVSVTKDLISVHVGRGFGLHRSSGSGCNAYVKVALVPSTERTFFRTPVHRESSCPNFNEKFSFKFHSEDLNKQILVSVWHRDRDNRKSEFLGCVSLAVKNAIKNEISGSFRLVAQGGGSKASGNQQSVQSSPGPSTPGPQSMMARHSGNARLDEVITQDEEANSSPEKHCKASAKKKLNDDSSFLRHLELEPMDGEGGRLPYPEATAKGGRTPFTTTKQLTKQPGVGFGFSIAWVQPPRVERVEAGQPADRAGIRPGDFVIFVDRYNVVMMSEDQILQIIKSCGNELTLEIYRKSSQNGVVEHTPALPCPVAAPAEFNPPTRWSAACSAATSASFDFTKRRLHLPQVAFTNEITTQLNPEESRKRAIYQLLNKEQNYAINLQFGINRFLVPLTEKREFLSPSQHHVLFQNIEEILRLTEETLENFAHEEFDAIVSSIGRLYYKKVPSLKVAYRRYCSGIKRADCLLAEKSKNTEFNRFCAEPAIPRRRPDLTTFLHKPLEHYRELLKLLQTILNLTKSSNSDHMALTKVVADMQATFREVTAGLMEPEVEGRPLLSVQDLESRLVFTRCKPFVLSVPGRQWIFGGDLSRVEGRAVHPFWALLFTDMLIFAKVSRDRVLFITEEPLSLLAVSQAFFNIRKKANEFRLLLSSGGTGTDSPANATCGPDIALSRTPKKNTKFRSISLRAPTPELKAVWQNLIQRQIIYLNTTRGLTPAGSPMDSPDPLTTLSAATADSYSIKRQIGNKDLRTACLQQKICKDENFNREEYNHPFNEFIDNRCRQLSQTKTGRDSAFHLAEWMKDNLGNSNQRNGFSDFNTKPRYNDGRFRSSVQSDVRTSPAKTVNNSKSDELDWFSDRNTPKQVDISQSASEGQIKSKSGYQEKTVSVCRQCHKTCLNGMEKKHCIKEEILDDDLDEEDKGEDGNQTSEDDAWGPLMMLGMCGILPAMKTSLQDPFAPIESPKISVLPPTPDKKRKPVEKIETEQKLSGPGKQESFSRASDRISACQKVTACMSTTASLMKPQIQITKMIDTEDDDTPDEEPPYKFLSSSSGLRRFGTLNSLERFSFDDSISKDVAAALEDQGESVKKELSGEDGGGEVDEDSDKIVVKTHPPEVGDSIRGWTVRAGSFVAAKMAFFERLSSQDNSVSVRKTTFLERYLKPSGENNFESSDLGTNASSSGRADDEGETSGATSGEEVWGTPTSGGDFDDEATAESGTFSIYGSPRGSIGPEDDTEQLMEDLLIRLPMLALRTRGMSPKRRLETLLEENDSDISSAPCSPKPGRNTKTGQGRGLRGSPGKQQPNRSNPGTNTTRQQLIQKNTISRPKVGSIDRALGIHSDEEEALDDRSTSPSLLRRLGLKRNSGRQTEHGKKCNKLLGFLSGKKMNATNGSRNSATYGAKPLFRYLFNKDSDDDEDDDDDIPTTLPRGFAPYRRNEKRLEKRFWKQLKRRRRSSATAATKLEEMLGAEVKLEKKNSKTNGANVTKKRITEKDVEIWEVAGLSCNFESHSKTSEVFEKLEEKRRTRHENLIKQFNKALNDINADVEKNIKISSEEFKAHEKYFDDELKKIIEEIDNPKFLSCGRSDFLAIWKKANEYKSKQQQMVNELYDDLNRFEDDRLRRNEKTLHFIVEDIRKNGYLLPYEVQTFAEQEILKINQLSLNNRRCYNDLKLTLTLVTEQSFKAFYDKISCIQEKWARNKVKEALKAKQEEAEKKMTATIPKTYARFELKGFELNVETSADGFYSNCKIKEWSENVMKVSNAIESYGKNFIDLHKKTLLAVFQNFDSEASEIVKELNCLKTLDFEEKIIRPIVFQTQLEQAREFENLEVLWQDNLVAINRTLKNVIDFLRDTGDLWMRHRDRVCETKVLILKTLEKDEEANTANLQDLEVKLNLALDALRQEFTNGKLEKAHEAVVQILDSIKEKYESTYLSQVAIVEEFHQFMDLEVDVLSAELNEFLYALHSAEPPRPCLQFCEQYSSSVNGKFICKEIQACVAQIKSLKSWKFGVWTALENFALKTKENLSKQAEAWVQSKIDNLAEKMTIQMELLLKRYDRINVEVYMKRLAEVEFHQQTYDSHIEGVKKAFREMKQSLDDLTKAEFDRLVGIKNSFGGIEEATKLECRPGVIKTTQIKIEKCKKEFEEKCKSRYEIFRADCENKAANIEQANINFMKSIKLFYEGGNYNVEEGKLFVSQLETTDKEISTEIKNIIRDVGKDEAEVMKKCSGTFTPILLLLNYLYEETFFNFEIRERIREFKEKIEKQVDDMRSDLNLLDKYTDCACRINENQNEPIGEEDYQFWWSLVLLLYKNVSNLFYPMKLSLTSDSERAIEDERSVATDEGRKLTFVENSKFSTKATISQTPTFRSTAVTETFPCQNYKSELFLTEDPPQNDGTFMAVICNNLWSELDWMQRAACAFYKKVQGRKIVREDLVKPTYEAFAKATVPNFRTCSVQCEQVWLQTISDFLPIVGRIKATANCFFKRQLDDYVKSALLILTEEENGFRTCLQSQTCQNTNLFESLDGKLLPLHGYPKNKALLEELEEEVVQKTSGLGIRWSDTITKYKNTLQCFRIHHLRYRTEIVKIQTKYSKLQERIFVNDLGNTLLESIAEYIDRGGFCTKRSSEEQITPELDKIPREFKLNFKLPDLPCIRDHLLMLKDIVTAERVNNPEIFASSPCATSDQTTPQDALSRWPVRRTNVLLPCLDSNAYLEGPLKQMEDSVRTMKKFANSMTNTHEETLFRWLKVWKFNVRKVKKLYTVKYEEKPKLEEKFSTSGEFFGLSPHFIPVH